MKKKEWYILIVVFMASNYSFSDTQSEAEEYNLKAAFLYNFTNFIQWEADSPKDVFIIGIIGNSSIKGPLDEIAKTKTVNGKKIVILEFSKPEDISFCNILFIPEDLPFPLNTILSRVSSQNTLTVTEKKDFALAGSCINFVLLDNKLKFETNLNAINSAGLKVSAQLLKLAIRVEN